MYKAKHNMRTVASLNVMIAEVLPIGTTTNLYFVTDPEAGHDRRIYVNLYIEHGIIDQCKEYIVLRRRRVCCGTFCLCLFPRDSDNQQ